MQNQSDWPTAAEVPGRGPEQGIDLRRLFFSHKVVLILMIGVGLALGYLKFNREPAQYASSARVLVARNDVQLPVEGAQRIAKQAPLDTHIALMRTPVILAKAVEDGNLGELASFAGRSNPASAIASGLSVSRSEESDEILDLTYRGTNRYDCQTVLNAVIAAYVEFVQESQASLNAKTVHLINEAKEDLAKVLDEKEAEYQEFRENSSLIWNGDEPLNIHHTRLMTAEQERAALQLEGKMVQAEIDSIRDALDKDLSRDAILMMALDIHPKAMEVESPKPDADSQPSESEEETAPVPALLDSSSMQLLPLLVQEQKLLATHGVQHPDVISLRKEISMTRSLLHQEMDKRRRALIRQQQQLAQYANRKAQEQRAVKTPEIPEPELVEPDLLATYIDSLGRKLDVLDRKSVQLDAEYDKEEEASRIVAVDENRHRALQEGIQRTKRLFDVLLEELQEINLVKSGAFLAVEPVAPPGPGRQIAPKLSDNLVLGGLGGFLIGLAFSFLFEVSDRSFRGPEQIMNQLGLPVVGHIPTISGKRTTIEGSRLDPTLVAYHRPKSRIAESFRAVRVPLLFGAKQEGLKVLQVTSPDPGDGKSTLSSNLAIVMANSGKRCLLVDSDFRRPKIHKLFGISNSVGLSGVLQGDAELFDAIQASEVENLDLLTTGPRVKNAAELILSPEFDSTLQVLREKYDFILLDTPPVLAVTDPSAVASKVDAVLLVMRITKRVQLHASRAQETLELVGAKILGVVVNGIGEASGYAYGTGVYSAKSSKYQYSNSPYYGSYYGRYADYGNYYSEKDGVNDIDESDAKSRRKSSKTSQTG